MRRASRRTGSRRVAKAGAVCLGVIGLAAAVALPVSAAELDDPASARLPALTLGISHGLGARSLSDASGFRPVTRLFPDRGPRQVTFYDTHLLPRLNSQFEPLRAEGLPTTGPGVDDWNSQRDLIHSAESSAVRGATKACRDFLIDLTPAERWLSRMPRPSTEVKTSPRSAGGGGSLGFSFGISHAMPELGIRYRVGRTETRVEVDSFGAMEVEFTHSSVAWTHLAVWLDSSAKRYAMHARIAF